VNAEKEKTEEEGKRKNGGDKEWPMRR